MSDTATDTVGNTPDDTVIFLYLYNKLTKMNLFITLCIDIFL